MASRTLLNPRRWLLPVGEEDMVLLPSQGLLAQVIGLASALVLVAVATNFLRKKIKAGTGAMVTSQA